MRQYKPIATYSTAEDIKTLFPVDGVPAMVADAENIYKKFNEGFGNPHIIEGVDDEAIWDEKDIEEDNANFILTKDKKHGVRLTRGAYMTGGVPYGFFIDIYELIEEGDDEPNFTDGELKVISRERRAVDEKIKQVIVREFKEAFTEDGEGLDFLSNCGNPVSGMLDACGEIETMYLSDGDIWVSLSQDGGFELDEELEDRFFGCDDWPQLLLNVRRGIKEGWTIDE